jgi:hypothetical protein
MMKRWYQSATVRALIISATAHFLVYMGMAEPDAERTATEIAVSLLPLIGMVADGVAYWGRRRAEGPLA